MSPSIGPKWNSDRTMSAPAQLIDLLAEHLRSRGLRGAHGEALDFAAPSGEPLHYANWRPRIWVPACSRAGLAGLTFHLCGQPTARPWSPLAIDVKTAQTRWPQRRQDDAEHLCPAHRSRDRVAAEPPRALLPGRRRLGGSAGCRPRDRADGREMEHPEQEGPLRKGRLIRTVLVGLGGIEPPTSALSGLRPWTSTRAVTCGYAWVVTHDQLMDEARAPAARTRRRSAAGRPRDQGGGSALAVVADPRGDPLR